MRNFLQRNMRNLKTILIIEDDEDVISIYEKLFTELGFVGMLTCAKTVKEAKEKILNSTYDLILCDQFLEDGRGDEVLFEMSFIDELAHTPILVISGDARVESMIRSAGLGANDYLVKPFSLKEFEEKLVYLIEESA